MEFGRGTTSFGFKVINGVVHGVESKITVGRNTKTNKEVKHFHISSNICCSFSGKQLFWDNMLEDVIQKVQIKERKLNARTTVSYASKVIEKHLKQYESDKRLKVGALITGWEKSAGFEVHTVLLHDGIVERVTGKDVATQGTGSTIAANIMDGFDCINMSIEEGANLGLKILFDVTYFDRWSGGTFHVYVVNESGCIEVHTYEPLDVHVQLYDKCSWNECTLIVLSPKGNLPIHLEDIQSISHNPHLLAAHQVAEITEFYVHRFVFDRAGRASEAYAMCIMREPKDYIIPHNLPARHKFHTVMLDKKEIESQYTLYVAECSLDLLQLIAKLGMKKDSDVEMVDAKSKSKKKAIKTAASPETSGSKTLFAGNLSFEIEQEDVEEFFKNVAQDIDVRFSSDAEGQFMGSGHVEFATAEEAQEALKLNGFDLCGRAVRLDLARETGDKGAYTPHNGKEGSSYQKGGQGQSQTIFVQEFDTTQGDDKGKVYMDFSDADAFTKAFELDDTDLGNGCDLTVQPAKPKGACGSDREGGCRGGPLDCGGRGGGRDACGRRGGRGPNVDTPGTDQ